MEKQVDCTDIQTFLSDQDLLAGSSISHVVSIPHEILRPGSQPSENIPLGKVRLRPLSVGTLTLISRAAYEDASLIPLLMIKESLVEPTLRLDQIRQMHVGLVHFLVSQINIISGLRADGEMLNDTINSPLGRTHILLAKHFSWTPEQVSQLTPGQVAIYLAGVEKLLQLEDKKRDV